MKSTGEVMGVGRTFAEAFVKSQIGAGVRLPTSGKAFISVKHADRPKAVEVARELVDLGFSVVATAARRGDCCGGSWPCEVNKVNEGRPHIVDMIKNNEISLVINSVEEKRQAVTDSRSIHQRAGCQGHGVHHHRRRQGRLHGHAPPVRSRGLLAAGPARGAGKA
jgi:carbamoyl-phosphate synthase large subunit